MRILIPEWYLPDTMFGELIIISLPDFDIVTFPVVVENY